VIPHGVRSLGGSGHATARSRPYILFAGRLAPYRNLDRLVQAFEKIQDRVEHDLVLAGEIQPGYLPPGSHGRVFVPGYVSEEELRALYRGASVFVFPSLDEGFGLTPLEAMAYGCPVVASREASLPEVCQAAAVFVDPRSVESIAEGMLTVLLDKDLRVRMIEAGLRRAAELTWENSAKQHLRLFEEVART
jgi:glycosyltransferase involved in cell wall biosynthesis